MACDESQAQYAQLNDDFYRDDWMLPITTETIEYTSAQIIQINEEEYNTLNAAIESGQEVEIEENQIENNESISEPVIDPIEETTVEFMKEKKTQEMSAVCNRIIVAGFDALLSDNKTHHFSLSVQDQLNLITLSALASAGETNIPYHADGELCKLFSVADITTIINTATAFKTYHITYFNSLKAYIDALDNIDDISNITYGTTIPEEYQSDILKSLLS